MRSINKRGVLVTERLEWGWSVLGEMPSASDWLDDGASLRDQLVAGMHGDVDPRALDEREVAHWQKTVEVSRGSP
jgi:hypothetical protein